MRLGPASFFLNNFVPARAYASAQGKEAGRSIPPSAMGAVDAASAPKATAGKEVCS